MKTPEGPEGASLLEHEATEDCEQYVVSIALSDPKAWCHACKDLAFAAPMHNACAQYQEVSGGHAYACA